MERPKSRGGIRWGVRKAGGVVRRGVRGSWRGLMNDQTAIGEK